VLRSVTPVNQNTTLFGTKLSAPVLLAPVAYQRMMHPDGELATVRGVGQMGAPVVVSTNTTVPIEELAAAAQSPLWFQLYFQKDRAFTQELIQRLETAGCQALCVTAIRRCLAFEPASCALTFSLPQELKLPHSLEQRHRPRNYPGFWRVLECHLARY